MSTLESSSVHGLLLCSGGKNIQAPFPQEGSSIKHVFKADKSNTKQEYLVEALRNNNGNRQADIE